MLVFAGHSLVGEHCHQMRSFHLWTAGEEVLTEPGALPASVFLVSGPPVLHS